MASISLLQCLQPLLFLLSLFCSQCVALTNPPPSPIRAVNLGAWFVTEGWMTPWLFDGIPNKDLLDGTQVQFKSLALNRYLTAENGGGAAILASRPSASGWETFKGGSFSLCFSTFFPYLEARLKFPVQCYVFLSNRLGLHNPTELLQFASSLPGTVIDVYYYNLYSDFFTKMSVENNIKYVYNERNDQLKTITQSNGPLVFVGEWTARLEGASDPDAKRFGAAELDVFGRASFGWAYWSYRNNISQWSLKHMIKHGFISLKN